MDANTQLPTTDDRTHDLLVRRIARLTRTLRQSMRELGLDQKIERAAAAIPDARDRLGYVAKMTAEAANRSLNAIDRAKPLGAQLGNEAASLFDRWARSPDGAALVQDAGTLAADTAAYLGRVPDLAHRINAELLEITMAQDFQDLTGQVIEKLMHVVCNVEQQLLQVLFDSAPEGRERDELRQRLMAQSSAAPGDGALVSGPAVGAGAAAVLGDQEQVDALLDQLGL